MQIKYIGIKSSMAIWDKVFDRANQKYTFCIYVNDKTQMSAVAGKPTVSLTKRSQ